jgi:hypothetical protein
LRVFLPGFKDAVAGDFIIAGNGNGREKPAAFIQGANFLGIIDIVVGIGIPVGFIDGF